MQAAALPTAGMGPLAAQHSSTMLHAKKQSGAAAAAGPQEGATPGRKSPWGWKALGLPTGPGAPLADQTIDPMTYPKGNKYAASWGLVDASAAVSPGGALSRQASAIAGGLSRQQSQAALQGQLSRQSSVVSQRQSPRYADQQQQGAAGTPGRQYNAGAAGRYAQQSVTPAESPRSGAGTPRRGSDSGRQGQGGGSASRTLQSRRISDVGSIASEDSGAYASADEHSRSSSFSGYTSATSTGPGSGSRGAWQRSNSATQQGSNSRKMPSPIPVPPAFLQSNQPTSAQAAVAAAWSPNKHASAMVQAPAYMRGAYVSPEASGLQYGESPRGLAGAAAYSNVSPRDAYMQPGGAAARGGNAAAGSGYQQPRQQQQQQQAAYAGGYNVQGGAPPLAANARGQPQQQQVMTAVDLAKSRSMRRTSSSGGGGQGGSYGSRQPEAPGYLGAARSNAAGVRGVGAAAGKAVYGQRQLQGRGGGRKVAAGEFDDY
jgi:hypothetical protein